MLAGCPGDPELPPFRIELGLDPAAWCASTDCADYGLSCGAWLSVRILDASSLEVLADRCVEVAPADDLCALGAVGLPGFTVPRRNTRVDVVLWRPDPDATQPECPPHDAVFDRGGMPRLDLLPQPAFARSVVFDLDDPSEVVHVPLACADPPQVASIECSALSTYVRADVDDLESLVGITLDQANDLAVFVGEPVPVTDDVSGETTWSVETSGADQLELIPPGIAGFAPFFEAHLPRGFGAAVCTLVTDLSAAETTPSVRCSQESEGATSLTLRGFLIDKPTVDAILAALALPGFPDEGLLVGRVIDHTGQPLAGVLVGAGEGGVSYLSADLTTTAGLTRTSSSGYFVSQDVPFNSTFTATHLDGRPQDGAYLGGVLTGRVSVLVIRMEAPGLAPARRAPRPPPPPG